MSDPASTARAAVTFRPMTQADIPFGLRLSAAAGWNQIDADWRRLLTLAPTGCFVGELEREPVGTVVAVAFGPVAWVSMVLVDPAHRGRGIGTALMHHILAHLDAQPEITSIRLDATDLGEPIYRKLGFAAQFRLIRLQRAADVAGSAEPNRGVADVRIAPAAAAGADDLDAIAVLDRAATQTDRRGLLRRFLMEYADTAWLATRDGEPAGYLMTRPGANATQIGPGMARDPATAAALLDHILHAIGDAAAFIDVPADNTAIHDHLAARGFTEQRRFTRMTRGAPVQEHVVHMLASSGPEKG